MLADPQRHPALPSHIYGYLRADLYTENHRFTDLRLSNHHDAHLAAAT